MSLRVLSASVLSAALIAVVLVFWAHVPGPIGMICAAIVGVGALIGLASIDDDGENLDDAWRAAAPDLATPAPPAATLGTDPALPAILAAESAASESAAAEAIAPEPSAAEIATAEPAGAEVPAMGSDPGRQDGSAPPG